MFITHINLAFLGISIIFYCLFAGADFGAGILEIFVGLGVNRGSGQEKQEEQRELMAHAIAPVWEANHVWLILGLVILFMGFPQAFSAISTAFHIPLTLMLVGIVLRGCAFTFRQYDAVKDNSQKYYTRVFAVSSVVTPFFLGIVAGGILLGRAPKVPTEFYPSFVAPWLNLFCVTLGLFVCVLFTFLAAVYLIGETKDPKLRALFTQRAWIANLCALLVGSIVFISAQIEGFELAKLFLNEPLSLACMILGTILLIPLWSSLRASRVLSSRIYAALQVVLILFGWFKLQYPSLVTLQDHGARFDITVLNSAAPEATQLQLLYALIGGCALIFPELFYLFWVFKWAPGKPDPTH